MRAFNRGSARLTPLLFLLAAACSQSELSGHTFDVVEQDGLLVATNSATPKFEGELFIYEKAAEIRADPDNEESMLFRPFSFSRGPDGNYYVADYGNHRVAVFDADGAYLRSIGRQGEGPGEIMDPRVVSFDGDVMTVEGNWLTRFTLDGEFLDEERGRDFTARSREGLLINMSYPQGDDGTGTYMLRTAARVVNAGGEEVGNLETDDVAFARVGADGTRHEFHYRAWPSIQYYPQRDELLMISGVEPVLRWFALDGTETRRASIDLPAAALTDADRERVLAHYDALIETALGANAEDLAENLRNRKRQVEFADPKAYWTRPSIEKSGWVWLRYPAPDIGIYRVGSQPVEQPQSFRVLNAEGEYIGDTHWPREAIHFGHTLEDGYLLSMVPDRENGETIPTAYRIVPAVDGLIYPPGAVDADS